MRHLTILLLGASLMLPGAAAMAQAADAAKTGTVAYPDNPSGTPQAGNAGAPVVTDKAACASGTACPGRPAPSGAADSGPVGGTPAEQGGVRTPSTAYPDSPVQTPAAEPTGTAPK